MTLKNLSKYLLPAFFYIITSVCRSDAAVSVEPKFLFLNSTMKSFPLTVTNPGNQPVEVWIDVRFGYVVSDDSGKATIFYDSTGTPSQSAVPWIKMYPSRFRLGSMESQIVRLTAIPQTDLPDGEYWARILVTSQDVKSTLSQKDGKKGAGMEFIQRVGLPFHFRKGEVFTGLDVQKFDVKATEKDLNVVLDMKRSGNASYWGMISFQLYDEARKRLLNETKPVAIFTSFNGIFNLDRSRIPAGVYSLEIEIKTEGRRDVRRENILYVPPLRLTKSVTID